MIWTSSGRPNSVALTASAAALASVTTMAMSSATQSKLVDLVQVSRLVPFLLGVAQLGELQCVELTVGKVATPGGHEVVDGTAVQFIDHIHGAVGCNADAFVSLNAELGSGLDAGCDGGVLRIQEDLEQTATGGLLGEQQRAPRSPGQPVEAPVAGVLDKNLGVAGLQVDHRQRPIRAHLVGAVQKRPACGPVSLTVFMSVRSSTPE